MTEKDWLTLDRNEEVLWEGEPRIQSIVPAIIIGVVTLPFMGIGLLIIGGAWLNIKNTDFVVTSQGIYKKTGVVSRSVQKIGFDKIQNISFSQGVFGNMFDYGNVDISTAGGSGVEMKFNSIENPRNVQELINKRIKTGDAENQCPECGHDLEEDWMACPECGHQVKDRCDNCGNLLEDEWQVCPYCMKER
jgi:uncharacterized membrane protein YdbT with pleckstrin-like domain